MPVSISKTAIDEIKHIFATKISDGNLGLRIGMRGSGCAGSTFIIGFDKKNDADHEYELDGIKIYIEKKHYLYLVGVQIDYENTTDAKGFKFEQKI
ncbi:MAG: iron-sulfur cluster assembly accessory protein [Cytophagales bacterium]|nr:iron-sulfur cluster assembly accessory protein [Cytophagales bacterium]